MTIAIRIGAGSTAYDNLDSAYKAAALAKQKLSITGTGEEIKNELINMRLLGQTEFDLRSKTIGSIKATNDLNLTAGIVDQFKAALIKLGTKSIVLDTTTNSSGIETFFNQLDAVYTKVKSITLADADTATPKINVSKLATAINLGGLEALTGKKFNVNGTSDEIKTNMDSMLKNISRIDKIIVDSGDVEFTAKQLSIVGDKLVKIDGAKVVLKDTADSLLATSSIALVNKLNNTNINTAAVTATLTGVPNSSAITVSGGHGFKTGDKVHFNLAGGTNGTAIPKDADYYVRVTNGTEFKLYTSYGNAITDTSGLDATGMIGSLTSVVGPNPFRTTLLDSVKVTGASIDQANRFVTLSAIDTALPGQGAGNRLMSDIIKSVEIADNVTNLNAFSAGQTQAMTSYAKSASDGQITKVGHGYKTGDAVTFSVATGGTKLTELSIGGTYYVGKVDNDNFVLFDTRAHAKSADYSSVALLSGSSGAITYATGNTGAGAAQKFSVTNLSKTISDVNRLNGATSEVGRVTIKGFGVVTALDLSDIAAKVKAGSDSVAQTTYSAKAIDIQNNMQALYDNQHAANMTGVSEIVVNDGTSKGKKALTLSDTYFQVLKSIFKEGVDKHENPVPVLAKNYTFNVTGASYSKISGAGNLQDEMDVGSFAVVGATAANLSVDAITLASDLGKSKLKTLTSEGVTSVERATIQSLLNSVGSGPDRAKLKLVNKI